MKTLHDTFATINVIGCLAGIILMFRYYRKEVDFKSYEWLWNLAAFCCIAFCFFGMLREIYSLNAPSIDYSTWMFKFATSGIFILTFVFYKLVKRYKKIDEELYQKKKDELS